MVKAIEMPAPYQGSCRELSQVNQYRIALKRAMLRQPSLLLLIEHEYFDMEASELQGMVIVVTKRP